MGLLSLGAGIAIGYVIGSKTGRDGFEKAKRTAEDTWNDPNVQDAVKHVEVTAHQVGHDIADRSKKAVDAATDAIKKNFAEATSGEDTAEASTESEQDTSETDESTPEQPSGTQQPLSGA